MEENTTPATNVRQSDIVETEKMSDDELREAGGQPPPEPGAVRFKQVVITRTPDGAQYTKIESDGAGEPGGTIAYNFAMPKPPVWSTWICLLLAWAFLGSAVPFTVFIGFPLAVAAVVLALVCLTRGAFGTGILGLLLGTAGSIIVYLVGILRFLS